MFYVNCGTVHKAKKLARILIDYRIAEGVPTHRYATIEFGGRASSPRGIRTSTVGMSTAYSGEVPSVKFNTRVPRGGSATTLSSLLRVLGVERSAL